MKLQKKKNIPSFSPHLRQNMKEVPHEPALPAIVLQLLLVLPPLVVVVVVEARVW